MKELKKVGILSAGKISAILMLLLGAIVMAIMIIVGLFILIYSAATGSYEALIGFLGVFVMTLLFVVFYAVIGFVSGVIYAAVYNFIARRWGGLKIDLS